MQKIMVGAFALVAAAHVMAAVPASYVARESVSHARASTDERFGAAMAISGDTAVVSAPFWPSFGGSRDGSIMVYVRSRGTWIVQAELFALHYQDAAMHLPQFGKSVAIEGDTLAIGVPEADYGATNLGIGYVYKRTGTTWAHAVTLQPPGTTDGNYGESIAISGDTIVIGAPRSDGTGKIAIYRRNGSGQWNLLQTKFGTQAGERFGQAVAVHEGLILVGAPRRSVNGVTQRGEVQTYVFEPQTTTWALAQTIRDATGAMGDQFGSSLALSGTLAVIGAPGPAAETTSVGKVKVYDVAPADELLTRSATLVSPNPQAGAQFGRALALEGDRIVVGAPTEDVSFITDRGNAYVFHRLRVSPPGVTQIDADWSAGTVIPTSGFFNGDQFGSAVAIGGNSIIVGAERDDVGATTDKGTAHFYEPDLGAEVPLRPDVQVPGTPRASSRAGKAVALARDFVVVGAPDDGSNPQPGAPGRVLIYGRDGGGSAPGASPGATPGRTLLAVLHPPAGTAQAGEDFGWSVDVSSNGDQIIVGAPDHDNGVGMPKGAAFVFNKPAPGWAGENILPIVTLPPPPATPTVAPDGFGDSVSISDGGNVAVGAPDSDTLGQTDAGAAFYYPSNGPGFEPPVPVVPEQPQDGGQFGDALDMSDDQVAIGEPHVAGSEPGQVHLVPTQKLLAARTASGSTPVSTRGLGAIGGQPGDRFGESVSLSGDLIAVGAPGHDASGAADAGAAYVFDGSSGQLAQLARLDTGASLVEGAGASVSISRDVRSGDVLVAVGADAGERDLSDASGSAYLYVRPGGRFAPGTVMMPSVELVASRVTSGQGYGTAVAADTLGVVVGAPGRAGQPANANERPEQGGVEAFVFERLLRDGFE